MGGGDEGALFEAWEVCRIDWIWCGREYGLIDDGVSDDAPGDRVEQGQEDGQ